MASDDPAADIRDRLDCLEPAEVQYAAGMVMAYLRVGVRPAFMILRRHAAASHRPLAIVADELVEADPSIDREHLLLTITGRPRPE
ncbi:MAG: hypothetical protein M3235_23005 [Actinomycetota bacterium]|nr:hypothetical protein [Actinomycetota bacterium]